MSLEKTLVLFPGAWGNETERHARWFFQHVIAYFKDWNIVVLHYEGDTLEEHIDGCIKQLRGVSNGAFAICYSMGAQVARGVAQKRPDLFIKVGLISGLERIGVRFWTTVKAILAAPGPILASLFGKPVQLRTVKQFQKIMMAGPDTDRLKLAKYVLKKVMHPQKAKPALKVFLPLYKRRMEPLPCPVMAICPEDDLFMRGVTYDGEDVRIVRPGGDHSFLFESKRHINSYLQQIEDWMRS